MLADAKGQVQMKAPTALTAIFMDLGFSRNLASNIARRMDSDRWNSWSQDDWAAALLRWSSQRKSDRMRELEERWAQIKTGLPDIPGQGQLDM